MRVSVAQIQKAGPKIGQPRIVVAVDLGLLLIGADSHHRIPRRRQRAGFFGGDGEPALRRGGHRAYYGLPVFQG
jgi:hypothetical protein